MKKCLLLIMSVMLMTSVASAEWFYGIGTGLQRLNVEGDQGFNTPAFGPVVLDVELDPDDVSELMDAGFGLAAYATDGTWVLQASGGFLDLKGDGSVTLPAGMVSAEIFQDITVFKGTVGYVAHRGESLTVTPYVGAKYLEHDIGRDLTIMSAGGSTVDSRSIAHDWTDAIVGVSVQVPVSDSVKWDVRAEAGFGGSEGSYEADTGFSWDFAEGWTTRLGFNYAMIDYENGSPGDMDFYLYDADEFGGTLSILYGW